jgi:threonine/homoserine/homoserine lactone efflux protein
MISLSTITALGFIALVSALTPGPNMIYLVSRSICQGRVAGFISLAGIASGSLVYIVCTSLGITSIIMALPYAYDALCFAGAAYLIIAAAGAVTVFLSGQSRWIVVQRWIMATVLGGLAVRMAIEAKK